MVRSLTFGAYLTGQWLPAKKLYLATSTCRGYERNVNRHVLPALGRVGIRRLRYQQIEALYDRLLEPDDGKGLAPKTVRWPAGHSLGPDPELLGVECSTFTYCSGLEQRQDRSG